FSRDWSSDVCSSDLAARRSAMFEDLAHNLEAPHALGMTTVLVCQDARWFADEPDGKRPARPDDAHGEHIHHITDDLAGFLAMVEIGRASCREVVEIA